MFNILVTGGAGFIGSHIVDKFIDAGHHVTVIDDESAICHDGFYYNEQADYHKLSITNNDIENLQLFKGIDYVFHLAAESRIQPALENPELAIQTNILGTCRVLEQSLKNNVKRVIYSSTSSAYGAANDMPLKEDMKRDCLNPYSIAKTAGEDFARMYYKLYGLETVILRYFNVYGERQPTKGQYAPVIGLFQKQFQEGRPMTIVGDGLQTRDYTHVSDVVNANEKCVSADNCAGQIFNIGTGHNYSIKDLVEMIGGHSANYIHIPERKGEARNTKADITKGKTILNWEPAVTLREWIHDNT
jgi:UDP-glucose 4-epimerase